MIRLKSTASDVTLTSVQKKMLPALTLPLPEECPTSLRYALAKYDAGTVADAWEGLSDLERNGLLEVVTD